jgi:hypothetical protein
MFHILYLVNAMYTFKDGSEPDATLAFVGLPLPKLKHLPGLKEAPLLVFLALAL